MAARVKQVQDELRAHVEAELQRRKRAEEGRLREIYDWYGLSCPCNLPPGDCRIHPRARPKQRPPGVPGSPYPPDYPWSVYLMQAGRGGGKTYSAAQFCRYMVEQGKWREFLIVGATIGEVIKYQVNGLSGLVTISPPWFKARYLASRSMVEWPNGAVGHLATSEEPNSLRGGNMDGAWSDEVGKWKYQETMFNQVEMVLRNRNDPPPQNVVSTTPTPTPVILRLNKLADREEENPRTTGVLRVNWHTRDNARHLDDRWMAERTEQYEGTLEGKQELGGELVLRKEGALWEPKNFGGEGFLIERVPDNLEYVGVGVDPAAGGEDLKRAAEHGIVVAGRLPARRGNYLTRGCVLDDYSLMGKPDEWGASVIRAYFDWMANEIIAEKNQGGDMVAHVIQGTPRIGMYPPGKDVPVRLIHAYQGKIVRAEPVQTLYAAGRMHHLKGRLAALEEQMVQYIPGKSGQKLDRVDALVHILTRAILEHDWIGNQGPILIGAGRTGFRYAGDWVRDPDGEIVSG